LYIVGVKQSHPWLMAALVVAGGHNQTNLQDLPSVSWLSIDSVFAYHVEKEGDHTFEGGGLLGMVLIGGIRHSKNFSVNG
jgi:hypothetical protein